METLGTKRVVLNYGIPTQEQKDEATRVKNKVAELIDLLEFYKSNGERARTCANAQTYLEIGCMLAVKAIFNTYEE